MTLTRIISAIGNNSSIYPLLVRDCGIEVPSKVYLTYKQNEDDPTVAKLATRERFLDEYTTSAVWLGGIPLIDWAVNNIIKKLGYNPKVNLKLFKEEKGIQGVNENIARFKNIASKNPQAREAIEKALADLKKAASNKKVYEKLLAAKFVAATAIPIAFIGFILPKMIFASSAAKIAKLKAQRKKQNSQQNTMAFEGLKSDTFAVMSLKKKKDVSFGGRFISNLANFSTLEKMETIDGGYAIGRVLTARKGADGNRNEAIDIGFKMAGMMYLNYVAPKQIEKILNKATMKAFKLDVKLDPLMLADKEFLKQIKEGALELPKTARPQDMLDYIDNNPKSLFVKYANKFEKITMLKEGVRDPRAYVNMKKLAEFRNDIEAFAKNALSDGGAAMVEKFAKRAKFVKSVNILANVGLSSFLLAYGLPKAQFAFRKLVTGSDLEPGIVNAEQQAER